MKGDGNYGWIRVEMKTGDADDMRNISLFVFFELLCRFGFYFLECSFRTCLFSLSLSVLWRVSCSTWF